jgi:hypothetical protein
LGINILSSNAKNLTTGTTGSGIFTPKHIVGYTHDSSSDGRTIYSMQIVGSLPVDPKSGAKCDPDPWIVKQSKYRLKNGGNYQPYERDFGELVTREITEPEGREETVCDGDFCCSFDYKIRQSKKTHSSKRKGKSSDDQTTFYLGAKNRMRSFYYQVSLLSVQLYYENDSCPMSSPSVGGMRSLDLERVV